MGVVDTALSYIGKVKYVFGADNIDGGEGDCSSFTETVFRKNGIEIGGDTETQWTNEAGKNISLEELEKGDLIFFKDTYDSGHTDGVSHVGIYTGNDTFVHLGSKGVKESTLSTEYWSNHYLGAKRFDGAEIGSNVETESENKSVKWWGNIVVVILAGLLIIGGVVMLVLGVKKNL